MTLNDMKTYRPGSVIKLRNGDTRTIIKDHDYRNGTDHYNTIDIDGEVMNKWFDSLAELLAFYADKMVTE